MRLLNNMYISWPFSLAISLFRPPELYLCPLFFLSPFRNVSIECMVCTWILSFHFRFTHRRSHSARLSNKCRKKLDKDNLHLYFMDENKNKYSPVVSPQDDFVVKIVRICTYRVYVYAGRWASWQWKKTTTATRRT